MSEFISFFREVVLPAIGFIVLATLVLTLACLAIVWVRDSIRQIFLDKSMSGLEYTERAFKDRLRSYAFWFSEDPATMDLINGLAEGKSVDVLREAWRKQRSLGNEMTPEGPSRADEQRRIDEAIEEQTDAEMKKAFADAMGSLPPDGSKIVGWPSYHPQGYAYSVMPIGQAFALLEDAVADMLTIADGLERADKILPLDKIALAASLQIGRASCRERV